MSHNCKTCTKWNAPHDYCSVSETTPEFSQLSHEAHPCILGEPIVASAIADYGFHEVGYIDTEVHAFHCHDGIVYHSAWLYGGNPYWVADDADFCSRCGLRTAKHLELDLMYEEYKNNLK